jgi:phosphoserine phosphatase
MDAGDVGQALGEIMTSDLPFDRWYRERIQELQGVDQASYDLLSERPGLSEDQELLFEWTSDPVSP